ncbi:MAG TPA: ATP-dependent DNA ligase [Candidatus Lustribacter sp.]|jgi:DNA ligase-1|nr:ATP-dependent DNA ligase [Candidatus Lustribacter sp.]
MIAFARACAAIAATASKLEKIALLAEYLRGLEDADLAPAARFFTGNPFASADQRSLGLGGRTLVAAAHGAWGVDSTALRTAYRATGDLGAALGPFVRPTADLGLFRETLTPAKLYAYLVEIAAAAGKSAQRRRQVLCERILGACTDPLEATYVIKVVTGELRIGLREGLIGDAIAQAYAAEPLAVRRASSAAGDIGAVAVAAKHGTLDAIAIAYHAPIAFMLATPIAYGADYKDLAAGPWLVEDKYDGIRAQAHVTPDRVSLFSRTHNDVSASYPEVVAALRELPGSMMLDGEIVAERDGRVLPFRYLQARLQRKDVSAELLAEVPVRYVVFDALAHNERFLLDEPLTTRREVLTAALRGASAQIEIAPANVIAPGTPAQTVNERFAAARERGHEGVMFKRTDSPYTPGRRGKSWLKLKRELATLDCVVVGVEWGHGRRSQVLSDYTFAVRGPDGLAPIGKAYSGLTDVEIAEMTAWFLAHRVPDGDAARVYAELGLGRHEIVVEPSVVVEIAFDIIQRSELHASGFSLRFPRIVRLRPDKPASEADTLARVVEIYEQMLTRERIEPER